MTFVEYHKACNECGSSDAVSVNDDGSAYCFSCNTHFPDYYGNAVPKTSKVSPIKNYEKHSASEGKIEALKDRGISLETCKRYGVKSVTEAGKVTNHFYPYYISNEEVGTKVRDCLTKEFVWRGSPKGTGLFGQQLFTGGGKFITITEGECDALAAYELLGSKWPVVSVKNGAGGAAKDIKENLEFLETFESIVINFDNDKAGNEAAKKVARIFKPGKAKILSMPDQFKDPNDILKNGSRQAYVQAWWNSKTYTPSGIINASDLGEEYFNRRKEKAVPYPWEGLNRKLYGLRRGELVTLTGGTGLGKSSVTRELEHWLLKNTTDRIGILALEENKERTIDGLVSIEANARLYIEQVREEFSEEQWRKHHNDLINGVGKNRLWIYSHLGQHDIEEIFAKLRYMIQGCDCNWVVVDHLAMLTSALEGGDERRSIDNIMTRLRSLVEETNSGMILVSHLRRVDGNKGHEQGVNVGLSHLRGSQSIAQLSDCVIALERNQQSEDKTEANTTRLRILKSRYTGDTGLASHLLYDSETGRLKELLDIDELDEFEDEDSIPF